MKMPELRRAVIVLVLANGLEWFDFLSYAFFAANIGRVFFPVGDHIASLLLTYGVLAVGLFIRPLGGLLFGLYADRFGRTKALSWLIVVMAIGTSLIGLTPSYQAIGIAAPLLVILARLLQGLSVGGQFASAATMLTEFAPPGRKMFFASFQMASHGVALVLASAFGYGLTKFLDVRALDDWGWRLPFLFGTLLGPMGHYIRHRVSESPEFLALKAVSRGSVTTPLHHPSIAAVSCGVGVIALGAAINYLWHSFAPTYVVGHLHLPLSAAFAGSMISGLVAIVTYPIAGWLADRFGAFRLFFPVVGAFTLAVWPLYYFVTSEPSIARLVIGQVIAALFLSLIAGPHPGMLASLFPTAIRTTGVALSYNIAVVLFGGLAPMTVTWLLARSGDQMMPAYYQIAVALLSLLLVAANSSLWRAGQSAPQEAVEAAGHAPRR